MKRRTLSIITVISVFAATAAGAVVLVGTAGRTSYTGAGAGGRLGLQPAHPHRRPLPLLASGQAVRRGHHRRHGRAERRAPGVHAGREFPRNGDPHPRRSLCGPAVSYGSVAACSSLWTGRVLRLSPLRLHAVTTRHSPLGHCTLDSASGFRREPLALFGKRTTAARRLPGSPQATTEQTTKTACFQDAQKDRTDGARTRDLPA